MQRQTIVLATAMLGIGSAVSAESVRFELIPNAAEANDMSPDGRFIVGSWDNNGDGWADNNYLWDRQTGDVTLLSGIRAVAVSDDGTVVLGNIPDPEGIGSQVAAIWTEQLGSWASIGHLPNAQGCPSVSTAYELSADGEVAVGLSWDGCNGLGFRWTREGGMLALEGLANGSNRASVVSADGNLIGGFAQGSFSRTPAIWDDTTAGQLLDPPNGDALGEVHGINDAGTVLLGTWLTDETAHRAVKWTYPGLVREMIGAGSLLPGWEGIPMDLADDDTIVGFDFLVGNRQAWIALPTPGPEGGTTWTLVSIVSFVESNGGTIPGGFLPQVCQAVSTDGRTIIGHSGFPSPGAFLITRCPEDVDGDGEVGVTDFLALLAVWGECADCQTPFACPADVNSDCEVDVVDFLSILSAWGPCP
jgi:uncharacterized membrane protein